MEKIKNYMKVIRIKHYLKNLLLFVPLLFSGQILDLRKLIIAFLGFCSFSLASSIIYIINDYKDMENDKLHPIKKNRPIAAGKVTKNEVAFLFTIIIIGIIIINLIMLNIMELKNFLIAGIFEIIYLLLNFGYSFGLKNIPILDIVILVCGFLLRLLYGAEICDIVISQWLYLTVISISFYMAMGKRRNEIVKQGDKSRKVLSKYNKDFLDKFIYAYLVLSVVFYSLWCIDLETTQRTGNSYLIWTIPLVLIIFMKYSLNLEEDSFGDPVDVILGDKIMIGLIFIYAILIMGILYFF